MFNPNFEIAFWLNCLIHAGLPQTADLAELLLLSEWDRPFNNGSGNLSEAGGSIYLRKRR